MGISEKMVASLVQRSISSDISSTLSSSGWQKCMAKPYCKWPVIAGIIVGCIIIMGIVGCLISCLCCGYRCCEACCCCCYRCCDCGGSRKKPRGRNRYEPAPQPYYQQPPPPQPMNYGYRSPAAAAPPPASAVPPPAYRGPQTATFAQPSKSAVVNEDELPPMPTWAEAETHKVEEEPEEVEMDNLAGIKDQPLHQNAVAPTPVAGGLSQGMSRGGYAQVPGAYSSPHQSPYDEGYSPSGGAGGFGGIGDYHDGYRTPSPGFGQPPPGYGPRPSPRPSPAPYRGFDNQPPPVIPVPSFNAAGGGAYGGQFPSSRSPPQQQYRQLTHSPPPPAMQPAMHPSSMGDGYSHDQLPPTISSGYLPYGSPQPALQSPNRAFSPRIASPGPPSPHQPTATTSFLNDPATNEDRPPSLLMAGRRPTPNSYRAV